MQCVLWSLLVAIVVTILVMVSGYPAPGSSSVEMNMATKPLSSEQTEGQPKDSGGDVCSLPSETGMCRGYFPRFFYNSADGECQKFIYGGCDGNANNFETLEACKAACQK
ncbi:PI-stichotoxin-Hcr2n-like [Babylonia areolata]|uniref:PI-stichotoxin-Hcr2n-like n=1 Tax=Babylonia areolata TaxID=304850 RepID=UPI003FD021F7